MQTIGIDLDGVIFDYLTPMRHAAHDLGISVHGDVCPETFSMVGNRWFADADERLACHAVVAGDLAAMPVLDPTAADAVDRLRADGRTVVAVTARADGAGRLSRKVITGTLDAIDATGIEFDDVIFTGGQTDKSVVDVLLDDSPYEIAGLGGSRTEAVVRDHRYNRSVGGTRRVRNLAGLADLLITPGDVSLAGRFGGPCRCI